MLRTALKPVWLLSLLLALVAATVFVLLSRWQFQAAETNAPPPRSQTENAVPLTSHLRPGEALTAATLVGAALIVSGCLLAIRRPAPGRTPDR